MKPCLIDTDILSEFFRGNENVIRNVSLYLNHYKSLNISIITYYEVFNGLLYKDSQKLLQRFEDFTRINNVVFLSKDAARRAAEIYADLKVKGLPIGHTDCLIAGIAQTSNLQLVTNNFNHFNRIEGLSLLNWIL